MVLVILGSLMISSLLFARDGWCSSLRDIVPNNCKLICPHAPTMPVALNMNMQMPAWYNIYALTADAKQDETGLANASQELSKFIEVEINNGIPPKNIVIGGFSQGGAVALYHALTNSQCFGGVVGLSCWLPLHLKFISDSTLITGSRETPIFQCHGSNDLLVPLGMGQSTHEFLKGFHFSKCEFKTYPNMGHSSSEQELADLESFLKKSLPPV